jgi:hypothetical protein
MLPPTPLFTKTFDFIQWLMGATNRFPKSQRFFITKRLLDEALNFQEHLVEANSMRARRRAERLARADSELVKVRLYLRFAFRLAWLSERQYHHAASQVTEIGKLLGAWLRATPTTKTAGDKSSLPPADDSI